jgi:hypothetical protein
MLRVMRWHDIVCIPNIELTYQHNLLWLTKTGDIKSKESHEAKYKRVITAYSLTKMSKR